MLSQLLTVYKGMHLKGIEVHEIQTLFAEMTLFTCHPHQNIYDKTETKYFD